MSLSKLHQSMTSSFQLAGDYLTLKYKMYLSRSEVKVRHHRKLTIVILGGTISTLFLSIYIKLWSVVVFRDSADSYTDTHMDAAKNARANEYETHSVLSDATGYKREDVVWLSARRFLSLHIVRVVSYRRVMPFFVCYSCFAPSRCISRPVTNGLNWHTPTQPVDVHQPPAAM